MQGLFYNPWFLMCFVLLGLFLILVFVLIFTRRTTKRLVRDLGLARHVIQTWFFVPFFRLYFWFLQKRNKLQIYVNSPIPWEENVIIAANHSMPKTQDIFLLPIIIFFLRPQNYLNPIRFFPKTTADEANFVRSWFFKLIGTESLVTVNRSGSSSSPIERVKERFEEYGGILINFVERGRTQTAILKNRAKKWTTADGQELTLGRLGLGAAKLATETNSPIVLVWGQITGDNSYPKISPRVAILGLLDLLINPKVNVKIDIGHPSGVIRPLPGENLSQLTKKIETALFETGEHQIKRLSKR